MATPPDTHETLVSLSLSVFGRLGAFRESIDRPWGRREREMRDGMSVLRIIQCV